VILIILKKTSLQNFVFKIRAGKKRKNSVYINWNLYSSEVCENHANWLLGIIFLFIIISFKLINKNGVIVIKIKYRLV